MTDFTKEIEKYYEDVIEPWFKGYVNEKHKKDSVDGMIALRSFLRETDITPNDQWRMRAEIEDEIDWFFNENGIPIYLEDLTGDHSMEIYNERQDTIVRFLVGLE